MKPIGRQCASGLSLLLSAMRFFTRAAALGCKGRPALNPAPTSRNVAAGGPSAVVAAGAGGLAAGGPTGVRPQLRQHFLRGIPDLLQPAVWGSARCPKDPAFRPPFWARARSNSALPWAFSALLALETEATAPIAMARGPRRALSHQWRYARFSFRSPDLRVMYSRPAKHAMTMSKLQDCRRSETAATETNAG